MRILQLGKYYIPYMGGIETHLATLCEGIQSHHEVTAVVCNDRRPTQREQVRGVNVIRAGSLGRAAATEICPTLAREISAQKFDLLHLHTPNPAGMVAYLAARKRSAHALVVTHHSDIIRQRVLAKVFRPIFQAVMQRADLILVTSARYLETSEQLRSFQRKCRVVPYGIDDQAFASPDPAAVARLRKRWGPRVVLSAGRLIYYKGLDVLLEAFVGVSGELVIVGDGPLRGELEAKARVLGISDRVHLVGAIDNGEMSAYYGAADVFALPSVARSEAFGIVQLEAMAAGLPVVNTALDTGVPWVSLHRTTGLTVAPRDVSGLRQALVALLEQPEERRRLGEAGRARVKSEFYKDTFIERMLRVYETVSASQRGVAARAA